MKPEASGEHAWVLIASPTQDLATALQELLQQADIASRILPGLEDLATYPLDDVGAVLLAEEALSHPGAATLWRKMQHQVAWSDLPILLITSQQEHPVDTTGLPANLLFVRRPLRPVELVGMVRTALAARLRRQRAYGRMVRGRERVEHALAEESEKVVEYARLMGLTNVLIRDMEDRIVYWNGGATRVYGWSGEEVIGRVSHEVLRTRFYEPPEQIRAKLLAEDHWTGELEHARKDGTWIAVASEWVIYRDSEGRPAAILEANNDITARKRAEEALAESRGRLAGIVESAMDAIITIDENQHIVLFNPAAERMFHCAADEALGTHIERFIPHRFREAHREHVRQFGQTGQTTRAMGHLRPLRGLRADGEEFAIEASISQVAVEGHKLFTVILRDITERKRTEEDAASLAQFPEENPNPVLRIGRDGRMLYVNRSARDWLAEMGWPGGGSVSQALQAVVAETIQAGTPHEQEMRSSQDRVMAFVCVPLPEKGYVNLYGRDVTDRRRAEEALRQSEEKFRTLAENARASFGIVQGTRFVYANPYFAEVSGYTVPELLTMEFTQLVHPDFLPMMLERARLRWLGKPVSNHYEFMMLTRSGEARWVDFSVATILHEGKPAMIGSGFDITEYKRAVAALQESQERFAAFMRHLPALAWMKDLQGRYMFANVEAERIFGRTWPEIQGRTDEEIFPPETARQFRANDRRALAESSIQTTEVLHQPDGIDHHFLVRKFAIVGPDGQPIGTGGVAFDITERSLAEQALRESEERYRHLFEDDLTGDFVATPDGRIELCNHAFARIYGFADPQEAIGSSVLDLKIRRENWAALLDRLRQDRIVERFESDHRRRDGSVIHVVENIVGSFSRTGELARVSGYIFDDTDRHRAEQALRESELFYRQTLESIPGMVFTTRPDGYCDYQSQQWVDYTGVPMSEQVGDGWNRLLHPDDRPRAFAAWRDAVEGRAGYDLEYRVRRHDGQYEWFRVIGRPIRDASGRIVRWFGVAANINDLKQTEQQIMELNASLEQRVAERTAEAEHRTAQLRELASELARAEQHERSRVASILHDHLQQLLVGAKFGTSVLRGQLGEESQRQALRKVDTLLDESLETSRNLTIELSPPILKEGTLAAALHWLAGWMRDKHGLQVHLKTDETLNPQDEGTRILLFESVRELLFNIVKHAGTASACATLERHNGEHLRIIVADAGAGFDPERHTSHDRSRGGFGLFSIRERLGLIGGRFEIESTPGEGTQMTLVAPLRLPSMEPVAQALADLLPVAQVEAALLDAPTSPLATPGEPARIRVLVADDHAVVRDGLAQLLRMHADVEVVGLAIDGQHAVELAIHLRPDVILMDVSMPRLNGIDATRRVRSELPQVCVIGLSMHAEDEMAGRMREAGAIHYLAKTAPPDAVVAAIRKCVCKSSGKPGI